MNTTQIDPREKDIQSLCDAILEKSIDSTGDYGPGGRCPFCYAACSWDDDISEIIHKQDCVYLIAKDLKTGY